MQGSIKEADAPTDLIPSQSQRLEFRSSHNPTRPEATDCRSLPRPMQSRTGSAPRLTTLVAAAALTLVVAKMPALAANSPDAWITTKIKMSLISSDQVSGTAINVDTVDGHVTLHGTVDSAAEKSAAEKLAREVNGVQEVRNLIAVVPAAKQETAKAADDQIHKKVDDALDKEARLKDSSIDVQSVNNGTVVLAGKAKTLSDHLRAIEIARAVPGVRKVGSEIQSPDQLSDSEVWRNPDGGESTTESVKSTASDMWITSAAKVRLMANNETPAMAINVDTNDGVVTLFGMVATEAAKKNAAAEVAKVSGVRDVKNQLQVVPENQQAAVEEKDDAIEKRVSDRVDQALAKDNANVAVDVSHGVAHVTGKVASQVERLRVLTLVRGTRGVKSVVDELQISN